MKKVGITLWPKLSEISGKVYDSQKLSFEKDWKICNTIEEITGNQANLDLFHVWMRESVSDWEMRDAYTSEKLTRIMLLKYWSN